MWCSFSRYLRRCYQLASRSCYQQLLAACSLRKTCIHFETAGSVAVSDATTIYRPNISCDEVPWHLRASITISLCLPLLSSHSFINQLMISPSKFFLLKTKCACHSVLYSALSSFCASWFVNENP